MLKNIGLNLSSLNYYISRSQNRPNIIKEFSDIALKHNLDGVEFYPSSFVKKRDHYKLDKIYKNLHNQYLLINLNSSTIQCHF